MPSKYPSLDEQVREELAKSPGDFSRVARDLGLNFYAVQTRFKAETKPFTIALGPEPEDFAEVARPGMARYAVAMKKSGYNWPQKYEAAIRTAQKLYDAGTHEMASGLMRGWVVLYSIPRLHPVGKRNYFGGMTQ